MKYFKLLTVVAIATIIAFFSLNQVQIPSGGGNDKVAHYAAYTVLVLTAALLRPKSIMFYTASAILYGGLIELVQPAFGREKELLDFAANTFGAINGGAIGYVVGRYFNAKF